MIEIEMKQKSTLRDIQLFMFAHDINVPIHVVIDPRYCRAANQKRYRPFSVITLVTRGTTKNNVVFLRNTRRKANRVT